MTVVDNVASSVNAFYTTVTRYAASHSDGIIAILLLCGVVLTFTGHILLRPTVFLLGSLPTTTIICVFGLALLFDHHQNDLSPNTTPPTPTPSPSPPPTSSTSSSYTSTSLFSASAVTNFFESLVIIFGITLGLLVGMVMVRLLCRVAIFLISAVFGIISTALIYFLLFQPAASHNSLLLWYAAMVVASLIAALLSVTYPDSSIILGTALDGAALSIYCLAHFLGHAPYIIATAATNSNLSDSSQQHQFDIDRWWAVSYAILTILLAFFGAYIQRRIAAAKTYSSLYYETHALLSQQQQQNDDNEATISNANDLFPTTTGAGAGAGAGVITTTVDNATTTDTNTTTTTAASIIDKMNVPYGMTPRYLLSANAPTGPSLGLGSAVDEQQQLITVIEPPKSPNHHHQSDEDHQLHLQSNNYGAVLPSDSQDMQYSVIQNLGGGAEHHAPSVQPYADTTSNPNNNTIPPNGKGPL